MKKVLLVAAMLFLGLMSLYSQSSTDSIIMEKVFLGQKYIHNGLVVSSIGDLKTIVASNELALMEMKEADVLNDVATVLACAGGAVSGWQLGSMIGGGKFNTYLFAGGLGVAAIGIGVTALADIHLARGATIYNNSLGSTSCGDPVKFDFGLVPGGVGLTLSF